jgi:hypothetical protein
VRGLRLAEGAGSEGWHTFRQEAGKRFLPHGGTSLPPPLHNGDTLLETAPFHGLRDRLEPCPDPPEPRLPGRKTDFPARPRSQAVRGIPVSNRCPHPLRIKPGLLVWDKWLRQRI